MSPKIESRAKSVKDINGKWVPSGTFVIKDDNFEVEFTKKFDTHKSTKKEADDYFDQKIKKELSD